MKKLPGYREGGVECRTGSDQLSGLVASHYYCTKNRLDTEFVSMNETMYIVYRTSGNTRCIEMARKAT